MAKLKGTPLIDCDQDAIGFERLKNSGIRTRDIEKRRPKCAKLDHFHQHPAKANLSRPAVSLDPPLPIQVHQCELGVDSGEVLDATQD